MLTSFISVSEDSHFPIQNLPYGVFRTQKRSIRIGVAIGSYILDMKEVEDAGMLLGIEGLPERVFSEPTLNRFLSCGRMVWSVVSGRVQGILGERSVGVRDNEELRARLLVPMNIATMLIPVDVGDYTDFYASLEHATNVGTLFRGKDQALHANWKQMPIGYHGRASSIIAGNGAVRRPSGQILANGVPIHSPSQKLDFELETAFFIGVGNQLGQPIHVDQTEDHIFGMVLMNDWSARDVQKWEYVPLGPFLGKSFCTTISPWVVTMEALKPFQVIPPSQDPLPLPYLRSSTPATYDIQLEVRLRAAESDQFITISRSNHKYLYWTQAQQLAHHTVNGCNMRPGDLLGSGTISGPSTVSLGCMLELTHDGERPVVVDSGISRSYLHDGDAVKMTGFAQGDGFRVGFGDMVNEIVGPNHVI
jgi:fumarylacetoacetase